MNETAFKLLFKKSVEHHGGVAISLNSSFYAGLPDLYILVPGYTPCLVEAKFLKDVGPTFKRKINYSPVQRSILDKTSKLCEHASLGLVGYKQGKQLIAALVPSKLEHITHDCHHAGTSISIRGKFFDIPGMFKHVTENKIPLIQHIHNIEDIFEDFDKPCEPSLPTMGVV